jgi:fibro-slime domain-containing protein
MFICLVGQTPITALAEGDDTRVISVPEGLQEVLNYDMSETQTVETEDTTEDGEVQNGTNDENGEGQGENAVDETSEGQAANGTAQDGQGEETQTTQDGVQAGQKENAQADQGETVVGDAQNNQNAQGEGSVDGSSETLNDTTIANSENQTTSGDDTSVVTNDTQTVQNETIANGTSENQTDLEENAIEEILEDTEIAQEITETNLIASIIASDGNSYETNVTYTSESGIPMEGVALKVTELVADDEGYDEYLEESASKVGVDTEDILFSKVFDIKIVDENDENIEYEPTGNVDVSIRVVGVSLDEFENVNVLHFVEDKNEENYLVYDLDTTISEETIEFSTDSFSVYTIVAAPAPYVTGSAKKVQDLNEFNDSNVNTGSPNYADPNGFYLSYGSGNSTRYITNDINTNDAFIEVNTINSASRWYFESFGSANQYYIYTKINGVNQYMRNKSGNLMELDNQKANATVFEISCPSGTSNLFLIKKVGEGKWLQHSGGGSGVRLYTDSNNETNSRFSFTYASSVSVPDDYYGLDGQTFGIAYHEESVKGAGMLNTSIKTQNRFDAVELVVKPDVLNSNGELLVYKDNYLSDWQFTCVKENIYNISTQIGGSTKYLKINGSSVTLSDTPVDIKVESGTGSNSGKYKFSVGAYSLTLQGGKVANGFLGSNSGGNYSWLNLVTRTPLLQDNDFTVYSAEKVNIADRDQVPDGAEVVVYSRVWNDTTKKYEFYVLNSDGNFYRAYESGEMIQWVGSAINTSVWDFTEYQDSNGDPTYYYQLKNKYREECLRPQNSGDLFRSERDYPSYFDRSINLNGRKNGYFYSTILSWDDDSYSFIGLKANANRSGVEVCPMAEAESFYFAIMKPTQQTVDSKIVETVDNKEYGITMKMVNFNSKEISPQGASTSTEQHEVMGLSTWSGSQPFQATKGLVSTNLVNGYPTAMRTGKSLSQLFQSAVEVNHLFLKNTYFSSGYYEFDSSQNFASFYDKDGNFDSNYNFTVYEDLGTNDKKNSESMKHGQFFPYNKLSDTYATVNPTNLYDTAAKELPDSNPRKGEPLYLVADGTGNTGKNVTDYYFGVEIEATFTQTPNGLDAWGHDIIYEFTGDDDFWLYVDGELVIDLGGIHSAIPGSVNYSTGEVNENGTLKTLYDIFYDNYLHRDNHTAAEAQAYVDGIFELNSNGQYVFKEYTDHTMHIFYMERGGGASNLHMKFNLASVKPGTVLLSKEIAGVDSTESYMAEYPFQIFYKDPRGEHQLTTANEAGTGIKVVYKDSNRTVKLKDLYTSPDGIQYHSTFVLKPGEIAEIKFPDETTEYYIKECAVDITTVDHQGVYTKVYANNVELTGVDNGGNKGRKDFAIPYGEVNNRTRVVFKNTVDTNAKGTLSLVKHLYEEDGSTQIPHAANDTTFTFRLYIGTENDDDNNLPPANMYNYHVRDNDGNYCRWDNTVGKLVPIVGKKTYDDGDDENQGNDELTPAERVLATFTTSMNGSIANIPVDYTVEVREVPAGTKYKIEEREWELPDGYSLLWYVPYSENPMTNQMEANEGERTKTPITGVIDPGLETKVEIRNIKGWGLRVNKVWSDEEWMEERDPVYFALYRKTGNGNNDNLHLIEDSVKQLPYGEKSIYWFIERLHNSVQGDFSRYEVREVILSGGNPIVDANGLVTNADSLHIDIIPVDGTGLFTVEGKQKGEDNSQGFTYKFVKYEKGDLPQGSNVRIDTMTNKRQGIDLYVSDWTGVWSGSTPDVNSGALENATFSLTDGTVNRTFTSDSKGLITIAYLREDVDYTLSQTSSPAGYQGMQTPLTIRRSGTTVTVTGGDNEWYTLEDLDIDSGEDIRYGRITIKNKPFELQIKKTQITANGEALKGVEFALYRQVIGNNNQPRKDYQPISGYSSLVTDNDGFVPNIKGGFKNGTLASGTYYLYETYPVDGYRPLSEDIVFNVDDLGYVSIISSPDGVQLNSDNGVDTIYVPNELAGTKTITVSKTVENGTTADKNGTNRFTYDVWLYIPNGNEFWNYSEDGFTNGKIDFSLGNGEEKELTVPLGAIALVKENLDSHSEYYNTSYKLNGGTSVNERSCRVTILDDTTVNFINKRKTVKITVKKIVEGNGGTFNFVATLKDGSTDCEDWVLNSSKNIITGNQSSIPGKATFTLNPPNNSNDTVELIIPYGSVFTVSETALSNYRTAITGSGFSTNLSELKASLSSSQTKGNKTITFTNTEVNIAPTGYTVNYKPFFMMFGFGAILVGLIVPPVLMFRRRREEEE